jgi:hypothetical protein
MTRQIIKPAGAARSDRPISAQSAGLSYQRRSAAPRALFAAPTADLLTLVIADAIKRRAQAEIQREVLRDSAYEMPVARERNYQHGADLHPFDSDEKPEH